MLVHFRLTVPAPLSDDVRDLLLEHDCATNVTVHVHAVLQPEGDLIEADVAREKAGAMVGHLERLGLSDQGGIVITTPTGTPFRAARELEEAAPGHPDDAVIWEAVEAEAADGAVPTLTYLVFLVVAVTLASIAVVTDSSVLVVGAMVTGPEFGAIAAVSAGIVLARPGLVWRSLRLLVLSFGFAVVVVVGLALLARAVGLLEASDVTAPRPQTEFIWHPDAWSFIVALLAGAVGALALAVQKTSTMVGVFISVTTVPAAGNLALGLAVWEPKEITGSLAQLGTNVGGMVVSGTLLLLVVRTCWPWLVAKSEVLVGASHRDAGSRA